MSKLQCNRVSRIVIRTDHFEGDSEENGSIVCKMIRELFNDRILYLDKGDGKVVLYTFIHNAFHERLIASFKFHNMLISLEDMTEDILSGEAEADYDFWRIFQTNEDRRELLQKFKRNHLTLDIVLDRIHAKGIESLTEAEWVVLKEETRKLGGTVNRDFPSPS
jgi:hypothetical protein